MNARERVMASLDHRQPDKIAIDFGGICNSTMHVSCLDALRKHYQLDDQLVKALDVFTMAGVIEDDLAEAIGTDCTPIFPMGTLFGFPRTDWKPWKNPQGLDILVPGKYNPEPDGKGGYIVYPQDNRAYEPSGHFPQGGYYFDAIYRQKGDIDDNVTDPALNIEEWRILDEANLDWIEKEILRAYDTGRATVLAMPGMGLGDAADIAGCGLLEPKGIRNIADWYMMPHLYPEYVYRMFEMQTDIAIENMKAINERCGDKIDVAFTCATDLAHQNSLFVSREIFLELYMPHYIRANRWIHENTPWKILKHSCGAVEPLIGDLIEAGFDALNPVQCSAAGMDPVHLKKEFGKHITFWGGGVDTQDVLPFGSPEEVRKQVLQRCEIFGEDGGFIFNAIHNVQANTPTENIVAMLEAVKEFNTAGRL
ncbi:MAG: uroporphyrinogen decarboxylase family protein [Christensenellales bacterium]|jgi:hypothetical protein